MKRRGWWAVVALALALCGAAAWFTLASHSAGAFERPPPGEPLRLSTAGLERYYAVRREVCAAWGEGGLPGRRRVNELLPSALRRHGLEPTGFLATAGTLIATLNPDELAARPLYTDFGDVAAVVMPDVVAKQNELRDMTPAPTYPALHAKNLEVAKPFSQLDASLRSPPLEGALLLDHDEGRHEFFRAIALAKVAAGQR